ncbi:hypothetical protein COCON_G00078780 [Conger conger]|uniref:Small ribosomal subunit protein mS31 n=1 Tax=Conger conger TaxID=82655 RepID=A0A9Q1I1Q7_CONCO|nr:28S ribosomal protein S31, mitochondrial [Conger conger]KAJ8276126.1 hypothetical protein COCON_G00078780 [Conger conger]
MYRRLFFVVSQGRNTILFSEEGGLLFPATLSIYRSAIRGGQKSLGTSAVACSEIKDAPELPKQEQKVEDGEKPKAGKENILDLLTSMKVQVTIKKEKRKEPVSQKAMDELPPQSQESLSPDLVAAASDAVSSMPDPKKATLELLMQLRKHEALPETERKGDGNSIGSIIAHMKVGKQNNFRPNKEPAKQISVDNGQGDIVETTPKFKVAEKRTGMFRAKRLNIFTPVHESETEQDAAVTVPTLSLWDLKFAKHLASVIDTRPRNGFEEMIQWTEEGKLWEYPVDNEAGMEEEARVPFHEHIFLEKHLEEGFPSQGPVRHFMELVVVGLSKNPNMTVREKVEHIAWFRQYFQQKEDILREAEAHLN